MAEETKPRRGRPPVELTDDHKALAKRLAQNAEQLEQARVEQRDLIVAARKIGMPIPAISEASGVPVRTLHNWTDRVLKPDPAKLNAGSSSKPTKKPKRQPGPSPMRNSKAKPRS